MGILLVVQGAASYPVRYHADTPPRTIHRLPSPRNADELGQFLHQGLGLAMARVQHILTEVDRWGATSLPFDLSVDCAGLFTPVGRSAL
jgi:hypothetical protein